jgi:conjugal transfer mating pair stabilization protein TraG
MGGRINPVTGEAGTHNGIDIPAAAGTPIVVRASGTVSRVDYQAGGAGNYIVVDHGNGIETKYFHMQDRSALEAGQRVSEGDILGNVGTTGRSTGPHLHYELWQDGQTKDPRRFRIRT